MCAFKTLPCILSKRSRVCRQNARVAQDTGVLKIHTAASRADCLSVCLSLLIFISLLIHISLLLSLFTTLVSQLSLLFSLILLPCLRFLSLHDDDNIHSFARLSVCPQSPGFPKTLVQCCLADLLASRRKNLSCYSCASLVPLGMKWACPHWRCACDCACACACGVPLLFCVVWCCCARRGVVWSELCADACRWLCAGLSSLCCWSCVCWVVKKKEISRP